MPEERARLVIGSHGERPAAAVLQFLKAVSESHDGLLALLNLLDRGNRSGGAEDPRRAVELLRPRSTSRPRDYEIDSYMTPGREVPPTLRTPRFDRPPPPKLLARLVPRDQRLQVVRISVASPGGWEVLGAMNPLTFINDFIDRRHERKKDNSYRNQAERNRLAHENRRQAIENELLEVQLVRERLELAQTLGIPPQDQRLLLNRFAVHPLLELDAATESGMAFPGSALPEVRELESRSHPDRPPPELPPLIN